ncbi:MAG TPA: glucokinase [Terriglobales bacterium]|nr:glucokinase [Terriglobales bacterium]
MMLIAGDIGGAKTDWAIYSGESGAHTPLAEAEVHCPDCDPRAVHLCAKGGIAIVAPGTGLGESFLTRNGSQYLATGSEGGRGISLRPILQIHARKGRFRDLMERMPIHIITTRAALVGAATFGLQSLGKLANPAEAKTSLAPV